MFKSWMWKQRSYRNQFQGDEGNAGAGGSSTGDEQQDDGATGETLDADADNQAGDEQQAGEGEAQDQDDGEVVITLGDVEITAPAEESVDGKPAPQWLKDLRKSDREKAKKIRDLEAKIAAGTQQAAAPAAAEALGAEPQPEDFDFDPHEYAKAVVAFTKRKEVIESTAAQAKAAQQAEEAAFNAKLVTYNAGKAKLNLVDFDDAEDVVRQNLNANQIGYILAGAKKPEVLVYALGRNPAKLKEVAAIKNPVEFIFALADIQTQLKVAPRKAPPPAERQIRSSGGSTSMDNTLARLQAEADKTGDRTKVSQYVRDQKRKAA